MDQVIKETFGVHGCLPPKTMVFKWFSPPKTKDVLVVCFPFTGSLDLFAPPSRSIGARADGGRSGGP